MALDPTYLEVPRWAAANIQNADSTNLKTLYTAGADGSRVEAILCSNTDTANHKAYLWIQIGGDNTPLHYLNVVAGAGMNGTVQSASLFTDPLVPYVTKDPSGNPYLDLPPNAILRARVPTAITSGASSQENAIGLSLGLFFTVIAQDY
jgi:hypothetical protein